MTVEFADGSDAWINPFNYRGYRRKGTVASPAGNYFYDPSGKGTVGFYPFNAQVWDIYYDYYFKPNVRFRLGYMDFCIPNMTRTAVRISLFWAARNISTTIGRTLKSIFLFS